MAEIATLFVTKLYRAAVEGVDLRDLAKSCRVIAWVRSATTSADAMPGRPKAANAMAENRKFFMCNPPGKRRRRLL